MRTFKFRAWGSPDVYDIEPKRMLSWDEIGPMSMLVLNKTRDFQFMQFIGKLDKNGREIFEGDILRGPYGNHMHGMKSRREKLLLFSAVWSDYNDGWAMHCLEDAKMWDGDYRFYPHWADCEIVGNIHENPELLAKKP